MGHVVAMGGGGFSMEPDDQRMDRFVLSLSAAPRPRVGFLSPNSSSDYADRFQQAFARLPCEPLGISLFPPPTADLRGLVAGLDVVYVGGGATRSMLAVWECWGLPALLAERYAGEVVFAGPSCGACCWFEATVSDSVVPGTLAPLRCTGIVGGSLVPHYGSVGRRAGFHAGVGGALPAGWGVDDGAAAVFHGQDLVEVVTTTPGATAYAVDEGGEQPLPARLL